MVREVKETDVAAITAIYNHYIEHTVVTFEETPVSPAEMERRIFSNPPSLFWLVYEVDGAICGYAYAGHLNPDSRAKGIGSLLYTAILDRLIASNYHVVIGGIALPNDASVALHEKFGYRKVAHFEEVGFKFQQWIDVGYWQRNL
jgi:L-amino acid N-acyltransferase YncA